ncbi:uncharacterized protein [Eucyclogobius newberryi]|uniref:uncharacterized protein n=1 Tax=Eucyclogobius newberryi TaxID=166745 RepID=UPI003B59C717
MVDFIKGGGGSSFMDILGVGMFGFMQNLDIEAEQIKESLKEEQKRNSKSVKNKRKKMRKKKNKQQENQYDDQKVSPEEEQERSDSSEDEENNNDNYKEIDKSTPDVSDEPNTEDKNNKVIIKEENAVQLNKEKDNPSENIDVKKKKPSITEPVPEKKTKKKSKKIEKTQAAQNNKMEDVEKEKHKVEKPVDVKTKENREIKPEENKVEAVGLIIEDYAKKSSEMAAIGNRLAASSQYEMAIHCFTEAIKFNPKEYKLFGNRSFCFERMLQFEEALSDAEVALSMEPNWIKGLFRKGKALCGLKKYYEASLAYRDVLALDSTSQEAMLELKHSQTLHLTEMGFSWSQCTNALKCHSTLEDAIEALFNGEYPEESSSLTDYSVQGQEWENVQLPTKSKPQTRERVQSPAPVSKRTGKPDMFPVWVGSMAPTVNYLTLQEVFSRAGKVISIKMALEHHCAFVNYGRKEDSARAVQSLNGLVVEGCPLAVRYPNRIPQGIGVSKDAQTDPFTPPSVQKECFFWRTIGCIREDCSFTHVPQNRGIDRGRVSSKLAHCY